MMFTLNLIKTSLPRIIPASKPCRYLLGNFLNNFLSWVNEKTPPPSIPLKHHLEAINAAMASVHFSTGLMQVWNRPHWLVHNQKCSLPRAPLLPCFDIFRVLHEQLQKSCQAANQILSDFRVLNSFFFFFYTVGRNAPLRGNVTLSLSQPQRNRSWSPSSPGETCLCCPPESPFWFLSSPLGVPYPLQRFRVLEWSYIIVPLPTDIITKYIYLFSSLYWVLL